MPWVLGIQWGRIDRVNYTRRIRVAPESRDGARAPIPDRGEAGPGEVNARLHRVAGRALLEERSSSSSITAQRLRRGWRPSQDDENEEQGDADKHG